MTIEVKRNPFLNSVVNMRKNEGLVSIVSISSYTIYPRVEKGHATSQYLYMGLCKPNHPLKAIDSLA